MTDTFDRDTVVPRPRPCASCPYRTSVASGIWHEDEYAKLPRYDEDTHAQPTAVFMCHQGSGSASSHACSGWLGHADPSRLLAVRIGVLTGEVDPSCMEYTTDVPLFSTGAEAAEHGRREILDPTPAAVSDIRKIVHSRAVFGNPVTFD